jgi:hypothetical protein
VIEDAQGAIVFDSTQATRYSETPWGNRRVCQWEAGFQVARLVFDNTAVADYSSHLDSDDAWLDGRTANRLPLRLKGLRVGDQLLQGRVQFKAGYNVALSAEQPDRVDGGRFLSVLNLDGVSGSGLGAFPGCDEGDPVVRRINNVVPRSDGTFLLQFDDCLRTQLALATNPDGSVRFAGVDQTTEEAIATIRIFDDCKACCDCEYFVRTYKGVNRMWDRWAAAAAAAENVRDTQEANRDRWLAAYQCRVNNPVNFVAFSEPSCKSFVGATYCNVSKSCIRNMEIRFTTQWYSPFTGFTIIPPTQMVVPEAYLESSSTNGEERYVPEVLDASVIRVFSDFANPQTTTMTRLRFCGVCASYAAVKITLSIHFPDPDPNPETGEAASFPTVEAPDDLQALWASYGLSGTMRYLASESVPLNPNPPTFDCSCFTQALS